MLDKLTDFLRYFFGGAIEGYHFPYYSIAHFLPILIMILMIYLLYKNREMIRNNEKLDMKIRAWLGFTVALANISWYWWGINAGVSIDTALPITVCETIMFLSIFLLFTKNQHLFDVLYFWTLCGSTNALISPAVIDGFNPTKFKYYQFWIGHTGIFIVIFYCLFVLQMKINFKSMLRSISWLLAMGVVAIYANSVIPNANYLFLAGSAEGDSILDVLPTYLPVRFTILFSLVLILFTFAYIPWYFINRKQEMTTEDAVIEAA